RPLHRREHGEIVLLAVEIAEGVTENADAVKAAFGHAEPARIAFMEGSGEAALARPLARQPHEIARAVDAGDLLEAAPGEFESMPALAAAEVEDAVVGLEPDAAHQQVDLLHRVAV